MNGITDSKYRYISIFNLKINTIISNLPSIDSSQIRVKPFWRVKTNYTHTMVSFKAQLNKSFGNSSYICFVFSKKKNRVIIKKN